MEKSEQNSEELTEQELKFTAEQMGRIYHKGLGNKLVGLGLCCEIVCEEPALSEEKKEELLTKAENNLAEIEEHYELCSKQLLEKYAPEFLEVPNIIKNLRETFDSFCESPSSESFDTIHQLSKDIIEEGEKFRTRFINHINKIRDLTNDENYNIFVKDYKNDVFAMAYSRKKE